MNNKWMSGHIFGVQKWPPFQGVESMFHCLPGDGVSLLGAVATPGSAFAGQVCNCESGRDSC